MSWCWSSVRAAAAAATAGRMLAMFHMFMFLVSFMSFMPFLHLFHLFVFLMTRYTHSSRLAANLWDGARMPSSGIRAGVRLPRSGIRAMRAGSTRRERVLIRGHVRDGVGLVHAGLVHAGRIDRVLSRVWWDRHGWTSRVWRSRKGRIGWLNRRSLIRPHVCLFQLICNKLKKNRL